MKAEAAWVQGRKILREIIALIWLDAIPKSAYRNIDPHGLPSAHHDGRRVSSTQSDVRRTLYSLCLVNRAFYYEARVLLFRRVQITLPYSFSLLLRTLGAAHLASAYETYAQTGTVNLDPTDPASFVNMVAAAGFAHASGHRLVVSASGTSRLSLMSPPSSRNQSPAPGYRQTQAADSPAPRRQRDMVRINADDDGEVELIWTEDVTSSAEQPRYHVTLRQYDDEASTVHQWVRLLDFSNFRTQGMRRTIGEGMERRFVTPARLLALVTAAEGLVAFGASETMDSALSNDVLEALLFRDGEDSKPTRLRGVSVERHAARSHKMLQSLDLCECISKKFEQAMEQFVNEHLRKFSGRLTDTVLEESDMDDDDDDGGDDEEERRGRGRTAEPRTAGAGAVDAARSVSTRRRGDGPTRHPARATTFPSLQRLGLSGVTLPNELLNPFVMAFPRLTHLDLSRTKADPALLRALGAASDLRLESLSLAFCRRLTSESITELLVDSPATDELIELSLAGTISFPTCLDPHDLRCIVTTAPCFRSGRMRYLDMGGCVLTDDILAAVTPQPALLDLGLAHCPTISLAAVSRLLRDKAPNVQVLELAESCTATLPLANAPGVLGSHSGIGINAVQLQTILLGPCTSVPPIPISQQLAMMGFKSGTAVDPNTPRPRPATNLRVVGLSESSLRTVRGGFGAWRVIWGAGRRGWVVDTAAGPDPDALDDPHGTYGALASSRGADRGGLRGGGGGGGGGDDDMMSRSRSLLGKRPVLPSLRRAHSTSGASHSRSRSRHPVSTFPADAKLEPREEVIRDLPPDHPRRRALQALSDANGHVSGDTGWHSRKMEVLLGYGLLGRESGLYALAAYQT
ncbi:uncharacterized protein PSFLO_00184 [Pseudozyma flocculosa]|uniref:F-box domain-containing protein n=1 Tax=Pseudozyma flocculosa TaxID=84751 RepID=A0A5C3EQX2_9BASI|nr:uncharacterized protein PSFLO_00184 [Pseudozyma flocculosa]